MQISDERAIEWARHAETKLFIRSWNQDHFHRLIEAAEQSAEKDRRIEELKENVEARNVHVKYLRQITEALRSQLAEKERELKAYSNGALVYEDRVEELQRQRNEERRKTQQKERELERLRKSDGCKACQVCPYVTDLETAEKELKRLRGILDRLLEQSDPPEIPAPTEAEVEKVASLFHDIYQAEAKRQGDVRHKDRYEDLPENTKEFDRVHARHVIERGYRREE